MKFAFVVCFLALVSSPLLAQVQPGPGFYDVSSSTSGYSGSGLIYDPADSGIISTSQWGENPLTWDSDNSNYKIHDRGIFVGTASFEWGVEGYTVVLRDASGVYVATQTWVPV